ncbi:hypothetical protein, partial [[Clostridium] symbiosum]|uniref:hypothetical protein n=1 Tax=Clostridium symbiosum TaxID=1512 RepID=UPI001A9AB046
GATSQGHSGLNRVKASVFRRWPVLSLYRGEQTTRLTGGHDFSLTKSHILNDFLVYRHFIDGTGLQSS